MDISSASSVSALSGQSAGTSVENEVLRKAQEIQAKSAAALINSVTQPTKSSSVNLPSHLGQNINTSA
ncbi:putative motility protein [Sulfuricella denitrificans]|uniref:putative motility protein n=1 Tax=Sulfuricella denitrificans TaxID=649841 RepID=UPI0002E4214A|nr:putative motility protein [Sulfuricella denitrificans]